MKKLFGKVLSVLGVMAVLLTMLSVVALADTSADKAALDAAIGVKVRDDVYTNDTYNAYLTALAAAKAVSADAAATSDQLQKALTDLQTAQAALTFREFGEVLATVPGNTATATGKGILQIGWTQLSKTLDLSNEDLDKIYLFATFDVEMDMEDIPANALSSGLMFFRSGDTDGNENNCYVRTPSYITKTGRNILYFPLSQFVNNKGTMNWGDVQTFRFYIDSLNNFDCDKSVTFSDVQIIRTNEPKKVKVACVGDSITAGVGYTAYPVRLQSELGSRYIVGNFGNSGKTLLKDSANGNGYTLTNTYTQSINFEPDVVTVMLGTNDSKGENWNTLSENFEQELRDFITAYRNLPSKPLVILATSPTAFSGGFGINATVVHDEIAPIQRRVAAEMGCPLIEAHDGTKDIGAYFPDGIHPDDNGHQVLAEVFSAGITDAATTVHGLTVEGCEVTIDDDASKIDVTVPFGMNIVDLEMSWTLMASSTVTIPDNVDFSAPVEITVNAPDMRNTRTYTLTVTNAEPDVMYGDVNGNQAVTAEDALLALQIATNKIKANDVQLKAADVDLTSGVSANDALLILQYATKKISLFPVESVEPQPPVVDKAALNAAIADAEKITDLTGYTDESAKAFTDALDAAKAVASKADATQDEVDNATTALETAQKGLTEKEPEPPLVDKAALNTAITEAEKITDLTGYTDESAKTFTDALGAAKAVASKADATQDEVDNATTALEAAQKGLTEKETDPEKPNEGIGSGDGTEDTLPD